MFIFISHLTVPEADQADLERHFRQRAGLVDDFPGFRYLQLLRPKKGGGASHTFLTAWDDADASDATWRARNMPSPIRASRARSWGAPASGTKRMRC